MVFNKKWFFLLLFVIIIGMGIFIINSGESFMKISNLERKYEISKNVSITIQKAIISDPLPDFITITLLNHSNIVYGYGLGFNIEKNKNGIWHILPCGIAVADIAFELFAYSSVEEKLDITRFHDELIPGHYRISMKVFEWNNNPERRNELILGEFIVESAFIRNAASNN